MVLTISAMIDGRSTLTISGKTAVWTHYQEAAPGRHEGANAPTMIGSSSWIPQWPQPGENRNCGCTSSVFKGVTPPLPSTGPITFAPVSCRESCTATTGRGKAVINFDDVAIASDAQYTVTLTYQAPSKNVVLSGTVRSQECAPDASVATTHPCRLEVVPVAGRVVDVAGAGGGATTRTARDGTYSVTVKKGRHTIRIAGSSATVVPESRTVNAKADTGNLDFLVPVKPYAIKMVGLARPADIGPLPSPISPDKVAFGDTVEFALSGWDPHGGPITVSWGSKRLGRLDPDASGNTAVGELKIDSFPRRGTLANNKPCEGGLTATQGSHKRMLELKAVDRGVILLAEKTHSSLKAHDVYCLGEIQTHPHDFAPAGGAIIYTTPESRAQGPVARDLPHSSTYVPVTIGDDLTKIDVVALASFRGHLCVRLGTNRWFVISVPLPGQITTIDHAAPCIPNAVPHSLVIETFSPVHIVGVQTITTRTSSQTDLPSIAVYTESVVFPANPRCESYLYGEGSMSFPAGLTGPNCKLIAQGSIEINGALAFETSDFSSAIDIVAGGDTILSGSGR